MFQVPESALEAGAVLVKSTKNVLGDIVLRTALVAEEGFCCQCILDHLSLCCYRGYIKL